MDKETIETIIELIENAEEQVIETIRKEIGL
jgi:hypothetical protein